MANNIPKYEFHPELHKKYLLRCMGMVPSIFTSLDSTRVVGLFFALNGLDILNELDSLSSEKKQSIVDWVYSLQIINDKDFNSGFQGSPAVSGKTRYSKYKQGHIAATYSSLSILLMLGDDLERVNRNEIIRSLKELQLPDGSFKGAREGAENDMRFVFCAACISYILDDWSGIDLEKMVEFIRNSISYEGGMGQGPGLEAHCGSTFCGLGALALSSQLNRLSASEFSRTRRWLLNRLQLGFSGRPNKQSDTCYSFWTGGALKILEAYDYLEVDPNEQFVLMTQDKYGGFAKWPNVVPDPMHTYFGLAGMSLMGRNGDLNKMFFMLNMTQRAKDWMDQVHKRWKTGH